MDDPVLGAIVWTSAPQVRQRYEVETPASALTPLVVGFEDGSWVLWSALGGRVYVFNAFLDQANPQFQNWAYFNYFIYHLTMRAAGRRPSPSPTIRPPPCPTGGTGWSSTSCWRGRWGWPC